MTEPAPGLDPARAVRTAGAGSRSVFDPDRGIEGCPFLASHDAAWSSASASRDLRCWATDPASQPAVQKQRQLCLTQEHASCATYRAAADERSLVRRTQDEPDLWPSAPTVPVALDVVHARPGLTVSSPRAGGQALLVGLMVVAFVVLVIARTSPLASGGASPSPAATPAASAVAAASPVLTPSPAATLAPSPTLAAPTATPSPSTTPTPAASQRTYKVRSGDTIASIAAKYHTTVKAIVKANNIVDPRTIHPGQVLVIP